MCSLDSFPGSDVPGERVLVEANSSCISSGATKTEPICLPRFRLPFFLLVTIAGCSVLCTAGRV